MSGRTGTSETTMAVDTAATEAATVRTDARADEERRAKRRTERRKRMLWRAAGYAFFLGLWQFTSTFLVKEFVVPPPAVILGEMADIVRSGELWTHFAVTLRSIVIGFAIAYVLGVCLGLLIGRSRWWEAFLGDWVSATMTTPGLVFALVTAMIFGLSPVGPIVAVIVTSFSYITVNVVEGVRAVPKDLVDMASTFQRSRWQVIRHVYLPFLAPYLLTATRYGFSISWKIATLAEVIVGTAGIGFMMRRTFQEFSMAGFLSWVLLFFAFALFLERAVLQRQMRHVLRWRPEVSS